MNQTEWIRKILEKRPSGFDPYVVQHYQTEDGLKYGAWTQYEGQTEIDERSVLPNEVVIDIDTETTEKAAEENNKVTTFLDNNGWDYVLADTGGTGYHIHIFFKYEGLDAEEYKDYREGLFTYLKERCSEEVNADTDLWDAHPVRFDISDSKGHLVRALGGRKNESENRKTRVLSSELGQKKEEIKDEKDVEYPSRVPWSLEISKTGTNKADLSIQEINEYVEQVKEKREKQHQGQTTEASLNEPVRGLQEARDIPASKVLRALDKDFKLKTNFECPFHADSNPSANLHKENGVERLYCFSNSCAENRPPKVWNAIDILEEEGYNFQEAVEFLETHFDVDVQIGYNPHDYFSQNVHENKVFDAKKMSEEIMESHDFVNVIGEEKGLRIYKDGVWKGHQEAVEVIEREVNERLGKETGSHYRSNTKNMIQRDRRVQIDSEDFTHPEGKLPFKNGVYDLETGEFVDHKPEFYFTFKYNARYRPEKDGESSVNEFIEDIAPETEAKQKKLKEIAALSIAPWKPFDVMPILFGKGSNGKNQYVEVIKKIIGKGKYHISSAKSLSNDKFEKASLQDKLMVFFDEFGAGDPNKLKRLTDSEQSVRAMHSESEVKQTFFLPIFAANNLPNVNDDSEGFYRRWQIIDFNQKFTDKDDDNPDMMKPSELENKYMNQEDIDLFATELIRHLEDVLDSNSLTAAQNQSEVRVIWEEKASAVYTFIDRFFTQGKYDPSSSSVSNDYIIKEEMAKLVNAYLESKNISKTDPGHITRVLRKHPDLEVNTSARPTMDDGLKPDRPTAYEGLRIKDDMLHDVRGVLPLYAWRSTQLKQLTNYRKYLDIVEQDKTAMALYFLESHRDDSVEMTELIKQLNLSTEQLANINQCKYTEMTAPDIQDLNVPSYSVKLDQVKEDLPSDDQMTNSDGIVVRPLDWVKNQKDSWSKETRVDVEDLVERGSLAGFSESSIEDSIEELKSEGHLMETKPGTVKKI